MTARLDVVLKSTNLLCYAMTACTTNVNSSSQICGQGLAQRPHCCGISEWISVHYLAREMLDNIAVVALSHGIQTDTRTSMQTIEYPPLTV